MSAPGLRILGHTVNDARVSSVCCSDDRPMDVVNPGFVDDVSDDDDDDVILSDEEDCLSAADYVTYYVS